MTYNEKQDLMWEALCNLTGEEVLQHLTNWHGLQLLDEGFYGYLQDEGIVEEDEEEPDENEYEASIYEIDSGMYVVKENSGEFELGNYEDRLIFYDEDEAETVLDTLNDVSELCFVLEEI